MSGFFPRTAVDWRLEEPVGGGHLVAFANEPMFRAWWRALDRLVLNAIVLGPAY